MVYLHYIDYILTLNGSSQCGLNGGVVLDTSSLS